MVDIFWVSFCLLTFLRAFVFVICLCCCCSLSPTVMMEPECSVVCGVLIAWLLLLCFWFVFIVMLHYCFVIPTNLLVLSAWPPIFRLAGSSFWFLLFNQHVHLFKSLFHCFIFLLKNLTRCHSTIVVICLIIYFLGSFIGPLDLGRFEALEFIVPPLLLDLIIF